MYRSSRKTRFIMAFGILCTGIIVGLILLTLESHLSYDKAYAESLIRLHVIANSNSPTDQDLKLMVRDAVLREAEQILKDIDHKQEAYQLLRENEERLKNRAQEVVTSEGFAYPVEVNMGQFIFPYREYGAMKLPEGWYDAVRVEIGAAAGDNWWCVLFPPLCLADLDGTNQDLVSINPDGSSGNKLVFRLRFWEHVAQTRYAQALQRWWQASAAGFPTLAN